MRKLPFILVGAMAAVAYLGAGQGCGGGMSNTGGGNPGSGGTGGNATTQGTGGTTTQGTGGSSATVNPTSSGGSSPGTGGSAGTSGGGGTASCTGVELTVVNYLARCAVKALGGFETDVVQTACLDVDTTVTLKAKAKNAMFEIEPDMWHHTDGDCGLGDDGYQSMGVSTAVVTLGSNNKCVWVCCEDAGISDCPPPSSDQCLGH